MLQDSIDRLLAVAPKLDDDLDEGQLDSAGELLEAITQPLSPEEVRALISLLPCDGDTAYGINWSVLRAIEAAPTWPLWELLDDKDNEWVEILRVRLRNGGYAPPNLSKPTAS